MREPKPYSDLEVEEVRVDFAPHREGHAIVIHRLLATLDQATARADDWRDNATSGWREHARQAERAEKAEADLAAATARADEWKDERDGSDEYIDQLQQEADEINVELGNMCASHADRLRVIRMLKHRAVQAEADNAALRALLVGGEWRRNDGRTYLCVRVADGADLSCPATREDALDTALAQQAAPPAQADIIADDSTAEYEPLTPDEMEALRRKVDSPEAKALRRKFDAPAQAERCPTCDGVHQAQTYYMPGAWATAQAAADSQDIWTRCMDPWHSADAGAAMQSDEAVERMAREMAALSGITEWGAEVHPAIRERYRELSRHALAHAEAVVRRAAEEVFRMVGWSEMVNPEDINDAVRHAMEQ